MRKKIDMIVPVYNEQDVLPELIIRLKKMASGEGAYDFNFIMVENGSSDDSYKILNNERVKDARIKIIKLSRNFGCDNAITAGLKYSKGDAAILMNADLQDPPELVPGFLEKFEENYEIVYGVIKKRHGENFLRKFLSSSFYVVINFLTKGLFPKNVSDFRLISRKVVSVVNSLKETNRFMRGMIAWSGFKQIGVEFERPPRFAGESKAGLGSIFKLAMNGIFSFSYFPLKVITFLGILISMVSFSLMITFLVLFLTVGREVPGHTSIIVSVFFMFGILFFILGVIGEYLARIYDEVKGRPNFIVTEEIGF